jgi:hypothetical protein
MTRHAMIRTIGGDSPVQGQPRNLHPTFTAESALGRSRGSYVGPVAGKGAGSNGIATAQVTVSGVSGIYAGTVCVGHTLCVITVDVDEHGHPTGSHCVDEIGSC